jgi:hypothetical protein
VGFCIFWFCHDLILYGEVPFYRDLTNYFYPLRYSLYESYRAGELPLWDRHFAQGFPNLAAFQTGVFYPPHFIFYFLEFFLTIRVLFIFHFLVAALGTYCLLRYWDYSYSLAVAGSLIFTLGGVIVSLSNLLNHFQSAVWLPWVILSWERVLLTPKWNNFITFTLVAALQFLAGSPEMFMMSMGLALLDGFRIRGAEPQISCRRILGLALGGNLLVLAITMAQFLPTAELFMESRRGKSIPAAEALMWSFNASSLLNLFFLDKEVDPSISIGVRLFFAREVPFLASSYLGAVSLFGISLWVYYSTRREKIFLTALTLGSLAVAMGRNALIYPFLFQHVSLISAIRFPEKIFFLTYAFVFLMTMRGLKGLWLDSRTNLRAPMIILGVICFAWLGLYFTLRLHSSMVAEVIAANTNIPPLSDIQEKVTVSVLTNLQRQLILSVALFFLIILMKAGKIRPFLFSILFVAVVFVDLAWAHRGFLFPLNPERIRQNQPVIRPADSRLTRFFYYPDARDLHPAFVSVLGRPTFEQSVALSFENYLPNVGVLHGLDYFQEIDALNRRTYTDFLNVANGLDFDRQVQLLRTFNVRYLVSFRQLPEKGVHFVKQFPKYFSWLYRLQGTVPRAYIVDRVFVEKQPLKALEKLSQLQFDPLREVVLDNNVAIQASEAFEAHAKIEQYKNSSVTVQATANQDNVLVLADSFYPGWKAFVDGNETNILRANHFFRAVVLPKGAHRVEFRYEPWSFKLGWIISMFTLIGIIIVSLFMFLRERKMAAPNPVSSVQILQN